MTSKSGCRSSKQGARRRQCQPQGWRRRQHRVPMESGSGAREATLLAMRVETASIERRVTLLAVRVENANSARRATLLAVRAERASDAGRATLPSLQRRRGMCRRRQLRLVRRRRRVHRRCPHEHEHERHRRSLRQRSGFGCAAPRSAGARTKNTSCRFQDLRCAFATSSARYRS